MKKFDNVSNTGNEKATRRGFTVPSGGVNLAWAKAPNLSPKNNIVIIDTSQVSGENNNVSTKSKQLAFSNQLGLLEDANGNQIWDEEYPVVSDEFLFSGQIFGHELTDESVLPYLHVSRYFHVDHAAMSYGDLFEYDSEKIKVIDRNGAHYVDRHGKKLYKTYITPVECTLERGSPDSPYRVYVFLDMNPELDELYIIYNKIEVGVNGNLKNQRFDHRELINPRSYFKYHPEESDIVDHTFSNQKVYSTKPVSLKQRLLNLPYSDHQGWTVQVPRKAKPDPRSFQLFRWRLACEFTQPKVPQNSSTGDFSDAAVVKVGVVVPKNGSHQSTRANYLFYQMNRSDYNFSQIRFVNPLGPNGIQPSTEEQKFASYWHVDIDKVTVDEISQFDILVWAPTASNVSIAPDYMAKIRHFTEEVGGTFIFETASSSSFSGLKDFDFSEVLPKLSHTSNQDRIISQNKRFYDATPDDLKDTFSSYGMWKEWPPSIRDILTNYTDSGSILSDASIFAGWTLTDPEKTAVSPYGSMSNIGLQYINQKGYEYRKVLEAPRAANSEYKPTLVHRPFASGGNIFVSTGCLFEDHLFQPNGQMAMRTMNVGNFDSIASNWKVIFDAMISAPVVAPEMKLRLNVFLLATIFKPSPQVASGTQTVIRNPDRQSITVYGDWHSSWVIDASNQVLTDEEVDEFNFVLQPTAPTELEPKWQRVLDSKTAQQIIQAQIDKLDPDEKDSALATIKGASKRYMVISTNPEVQVSSSDLIEDTTTLTAWTDSYSPPFTVPYYEGPFAIRDEMIAGTGVGEGKRVFPPKPYNIQGKARYVSTSTSDTEITARIRVTATVTRTLQIKEDAVTEKEWIPGLPVTGTKMVDTVLHASSGGEVQLNPIPFYRPQHMWPYLPPQRINTWGDAHFEDGPTQNWPYFGRYGRISRTGSSQSGHILYNDVLHVQRIMNQHIFYKDIPGPYLLEDGKYGALTEAKVKLYQAWKGAYWVDGIIDAETWSLLGYSLLGLNNLKNWYQNVPGLRVWTDDARRYMGLESISDDKPSSLYIRQSHYVNGPSSIRQAWWIRLSDAHPFANAVGRFTIYEVNIMPWGEGMNLDWLDVYNSNTFYGYRFDTGFPGKMNLTTSDGKWIKVPFKDRQANTVAFALNSSRSVGLGTARFLGVREVAMYAKRPVQYQSTTPGSWQEKEVTPAYIRSIPKTSTITYEARLKFVAGIPTIIDAKAALASELKRLRDEEPTANIQSDTVSAINWNAGTIQFLDDVPAGFFNVTINNISPTNSKLRIKFDGYGLTVLNPGQYLEATTIGDGDVEYYVKNVDNEIDPYPRKYGWVSKEDGIKLMCTADGRPFGIPTTMPTDSNNNTHFTKISAEATEIDQTIHYGFYDNNVKEWVVNSNGYPSISYYDYIRRGPNNIFLAVETTYELDTTSNLPSSTDPVMRPFKWAMPVYGITTNTQSKIRVDPLSPDLGIPDVWPVPIKTGSFMKSIALPARSSGPIVGLLEDFQGSTIYAYYSVPESKTGPWSKLFGRPFKDVVNERPIILADRIIKVRQPSILMVQEPTGGPSISDPWRPVLKIQFRDALGQPWYDLEVSDVADYKSATGEIILNRNVPSKDPRLIRVSYTSENKTYDFKYDGLNRVNLNPFINDNPDISNRAIYVYVLPEYVTDKDYNIVPNTKNERTLRITTDPSMFVVGNVDYDPLAILLGVVYITTGFDVSALSLLDTRRRGGGVTTAKSDREVIESKDMPETEHYWDIIEKTTTAHQKGGFVIIRLPEEVVDTYSEQEVINVIERNITLGVRYKLETLDGQPLNWSSNGDDL